MAVVNQPENLPEISISAETVFFIIVKAREFDVKEAPSESDPGGSNASDDHMISVLEDHGDDASEEEASELIQALSYDQQVDLVALAWIGRGDYTVADWDEVRGEAASAHNDRTAPYLLGMPLLPDYLEEGLSMLGHSVEEFEIGRL